MGGYATTTYKGEATIGGLTLHDVVVIPTAPRKLVSWGTLKQEGAELEMKQGTGSITINGLIIPLIQQGKFKIIKVQEVLSTEQEWHERYGHLPFPAFRKISEAPQSIANYQGQCDACQRAKHTKPASPPQGDIRTTRVGQIVHSDLCGPLPVQSINGQRYYVTLVDDFSRITMTRAIKQKSDVARDLKVMIEKFESLFNCRVAELKTDFGGEYGSKDLGQWLESKGISKKPTVAYHSETNAIAERINRTLNAMIRANIMGAKVPRNLWNLALEYFTYTKNRIPHATLQGRAPLEIAGGSKVDIKTERKFFRPFGQTVYCHVYTDNKLAERACEARIMGYTPTHGVYKVMLPSRRITTAKNPQPRIISEPTPIMEVQEESHEEQPQPPNEDEPSTVPPPAPIKPTHTKNLFPEAVSRLKGLNPLPGSFLQVRSLKDSPSILRTSTRSGKGRDLRTRLDEDPKYLFGGSRHNQNQNNADHKAHLTMSEALAGRDLQLWEKARDREIAQLEKYGVIEWIDTVPAGKKIVDTKWVLREKEEKAITDEKRYKARLTARGFTQRPGIDFTDTYAPVCREETWRILICMALS